MIGSAGGIATATAADAIAPIMNPCINLKYGKLVLLIVVVIFTSWANDLG
jgi:hypothetical protein